MRRQLKDYYEIKFDTGVYYIHIFDNTHIYLVIFSNKHNLTLRRIKFQCI